MKDVNSWNHYKISYNYYITSIIDALIVDQETAILHSSQDGMCRSLDTFTEVYVCDGIDLVNPGSNLAGLRVTTPLPLSQIIRTLVNLRVRMLISQTKLEVCWGYRTEASHSSVWTDSRSP